MFVIKHKSKQLAIHLFKHCKCTKASANLNAITESIMYFKSLDAQNFSFKGSLLTPSSNFNMDVVLNFPLLNLPNANKVGEGVPYIQTLEKYSFPSVTTILSKTTPPENLVLLERWKKRMISELGEEGFKQYQKEILSNGSSLHHCIAEYLQGIPESEIKIKEPNVGHWNSLRSVLPAIGNVRILEKRILHPYLLYKGIVDCVATYRDQLVVIDWKTSKKHKRTMSSIYDNPLQVAAYVGALNYDTSHNIEVDSALVVVAYENGDPGDIHYIPRPLCHMYWKEWLKRLNLYWDIMNRN